MSRSRIIVAETSPPDRSNCAKYIGYFEDDFSIASASRTGRFKFVCQKFHHDRSIAPAALRGRSIVITTSIAVIVMSDFKVIVNGFQQGGVP
jgi:hypothetical protein